MREIENLTRNEARCLAAEVESLKRAQKASGSSSIAGGWNGADEKQIFTGGHSKKGQRINSEK